MKHGDRERMSDQGFVFICGVLSLAIFWFKYKTAILKLYNEYRIIMALAISFGVLASYLKFKTAFLRVKKRKDIEDEILSPTPDEDSLFAGISDTGKRIYIKQSHRRMHVQVIGTTNAGKTESVILPWAIDDIKKGRGLLIVDGKSDRGLLNKLYAYAQHYNRESDVRILSICSPDISHTFNFLANGSPLEVVERVFRGFNFENEYFKGLQYEALLHLLLLFEKKGVVPTPARVIEAAQSPVALKNLADLPKDSPEMLWVRDFLSLTKEEREQRTSGLITQLRVFTVGDMRSIFNGEKSNIDMEQVLEQNLIVYCQLPALKIPSLGKATGKLILQCLQNAVSSRHLGETSSKNFFSVYLDDFTEYLTDGFVTLLNKSRSANVGIVFAHQALGDLAALGDGIMNSILTNANLKVFMRTNEPESAEYFSSVIGTSETLKVTERQKRGMLGAARTGDGSVRDVEEFKFHPNLFKQSIGVGEAVIVVPHAQGSLPVKLKFRKSPDLDVPQIPVVPKVQPTGLQTNPKERQKKQLNDLDHLLNLEPETDLKEVA